jgi:DNA modification methylase
MRESATWQDVIQGEARWSVEQGSSLRRLPELPDGCIHCAITSPPYFGLRSYLKPDDPGKAEEIGTEKTPAEYIAKLVALFREVRRVLHDSGTLWLNVGDSYNGGGVGGGKAKGSSLNGPSNRERQGDERFTLNAPGAKPKDLLMIPALLAIALREDGWYLRSEITLTKLSPMPESCRDRPTSATEKLYLLTKKATYYYDQEAERIPHTVSSVSRLSQNNGNPVWNGNRERDFPGSQQTQNIGQMLSPGGRNLWNWWEWRPEGSEVDHYATFPTWLPRRCIRLGTSEHGCCPACRAPYRRVLEKKALKRQRPNELTKRTGANGTGNHCANTVAGVAVEMVGWEPGCTCSAGEPVPCIVLDPFSGAGTTVREALRLGRRGIGIELSGKYADLSRRRIVEDQPLFNAPAAAEEPALMMFPE